MEDLGTSQTQTLSPMSPSQTWNTMAKARDTNTTREATDACKTSGIRPPQVRTNPRVTRQGIHSTTDSESSGDSQVSPKAPKMAQEFDKSGVDLNLLPLSPSSTLTRQGAFRYGRGIKPLQVRNLGSGAATLPRMRPKGSGTAARSLDIFTKPGDVSSSNDIGKSKIPKEEQINKDPPNTSSRRTSQRSKSVYGGIGKTHEAKQTDQERSTSTRKKPEHSYPVGTGPKISKGVKGGVNIPRIPKDPEPIPSNHQSQQSKSVETPREQKPLHHTSMNSNSSNKKESLTHQKSVPKSVDLATQVAKVSVSPPVDLQSKKSANVEYTREHKLRTHAGMKSSSPCDKGLTYPRSVPTRRANRFVAQSNVESSPKAPPRRQHIVPKPINGLSSSQTHTSKTSRTSRESSNSREHINTLASPKPPPRRSKAQPPFRNTESPIPVPTITPRIHSAKSRDSSRQSRQSQPQDSSKHLPMSVKVHLTNKGPSSYPQGSTIMAVKEVRSQSVSHIPVPNSRKSSIPRAHRQVKLRPKVSKLDMPNPIFRLSLDGGDSGTENSSSLATTPSECSIDIDFSCEDGSPVCRLTPAKFYTIAGMEEPAQVESSSDNADKTWFQKTGETESEEMSVVEITHISEPQTSAKYQSQTWNHEENTMTRRTKLLTPVIPKDGEISHLQSRSDEEPIKPQQETNTSTSEITMPKRETLASESCIPNSVDSIKIIDCKYLDVHSKSVDHTTFPDHTIPVDPAQLHEVEAKTSLDNTTSIMNAKRNCETSCETSEENMSKRTDDNFQRILSQHQPGEEPSKSTSVVRCKIGQEIALKVARGDLKASSVDGDEETPHSSLKDDINHLATPHEVSSTELGGSAHEEATMDNFNISGKVLNTFNK